MCTDHWIASQGQKALAIPISAAIRDVTGYLEDPSCVSPPKRLDLPEAYWKYVKDQRGDILGFAKRLYAPLATRHLRRRAFRRSIFGDGSVTWCVTCAGQEHRLRITPSGAVAFLDHSKDELRSARALSILGAPLPECLGLLRFFQERIKLMPGSAQWQMSEHMHAVRIAAEIRYARDVLRDETGSRGPSTNAQSVDSSKSDERARREAWAAERLTEAAASVLRALKYGKISVNKRKRLVLARHLGLPFSWMRLFWSKRCAVRWNDETYFVLSAHEGPRNTTLRLLVRRGRGASKLSSIVVSIPTKEVQYVSVRKPRQR